MVKVFLGKVITINITNGVLMPAYQPKSDKLPFHIELIFLFSNFRSVYAGAHYWPFGMTSQLQL